MNTIEQITSNQTYKQILQDSFGGIMYDVSNQNKYDTKELLNLYNSLTLSEKDATGGIMKGAINFVTGK